MNPPEYEVFGLGINQVQLTQNDAIGKTDLCRGDAMFVQLRQYMVGINQCNDGIQHHARADDFVDKEGLDDGGRVGQAGGFQNQAFDGQVSSIHACQDVLQGLGELTAYATADATIA